MEHEHHPPPGGSNEPPFWRSRYAIGYLVIGAVAGYYLLTEHLAHVVGALPFLLLLSCPLMHFFMHGGHGGHGGHGSSHDRDHEHGEGRSDRPGPAKPGGPS